MYDRGRRAACRGETVDGSRYNRTHVRITCSGIRRRDRVCGSGRGRPGYSGTGRRGDGTGRPAAVAGGASAGARGDVGRSTPARLPAGTPAGGRRPDVRLPRSRARRRCGSGGSACAGGPATTAPRRSRPPGSPSSRCCAARPRCRGRCCSATPWTCVTGSRDSGRDCWPGRSRTGRPAASHDCAPCSTGTGPAPSTPQSPVWSETWPGAGCWRPSRVRSSASTPRAMPNAGRRPSPARTSPRAATAAPTPRGCGPWSPAARRPGGADGRHGPAPRGPAGRRR